MLRTFGTYLKWMAAPEPWLTVAGHRSWMALLATVILTTAVGFFVLRGWRRGDRKPAFFFLWFLIPLAPILPLREHVTDYYLTIPALGIAAILALGFKDFSESVWLPATVAAIFLFMHAPATRFATHWYYERSIEVRSLVRGVIRAREIHPDQAILLTGVSPILVLLTSLAHSPFYVVGIENVYLSPETHIAGYENLVSPIDHILPAGPTLRALETEQIQVYQAWAVIV